LLKKKKYRVLRVAECPSSIKDARFLKVKQAAESPFFLFKMPFIS
jgi:hypothetical protein